MNTTTHYGAAWASGPLAAVGVLRARAARTLELRPVDSVAAAAAAVAAHVWCAAMRETAIEFAYRHDNASVQAAARILSRAAGHRSDKVQGKRDLQLQGGCPNRVVEAVATAEQELLAWFGRPQDVETVLRTAALDLVDEESTSRVLTHAGWLLEHVSSTVGESLT